MEGPFRIFVGSDRSQALAVKVLEYSIRRHTDLPIVLTPMDSLNLPEPEDPRQGSRTGFSFTRFAIPRLAGYQGKALYLDADMQVFSDIRELVEIPFEGAKVVIQEGVPEEHQPAAGQVGAPEKRIKQCSVMLLDCDRLDWVPEDIISRLGIEYTYEQLLYELCILEDSDIRYGIPFEWNSLETFVAGKTRLIHYTDMYTQPWASPANPNGWVWIEEVRRMIHDGALSVADISEEIRLGFFRPSLLEDVQANADLSRLDPARVRRQEKADDDAGFVKHKDVYHRKQQRSKLVAEYEARLRAEKNRESRAFLDRISGVLARLNS